MTTFALFFLKRFDVCMKEVNHDGFFKKLQSSVDDEWSVSMRETATIEFKESFNWSNRDKYAKSLAAFSNNKGGYLIFGIADTPRKLKGLSSNKFDILDEVKITFYLNSLFSPEIHYEKFIFNIKDKQIGVIYVYPSDDKPIIAIKNNNDIHEAEIYYRYTAHNDKIKYPQLKKLFLEIKEKEKRDWMKLFEKISKIGPSNSAILDMINGTIEGDGNSVLIDQKLIKKLKFIKEGNFSNKGKPTLRLVGDVRPIVVNKYKTDKTKLRITDDPSALAVREETILKNYPLDYRELVRKLNHRYSDFKTNPEFHSVRKKLMVNEKFCKARYLDPNNTKGAKKDFYSEAVIKQFDKYYTKKRK